MARIVAEKSESSFSQVIHSAGVRRFGGAQLKLSWQTDRLSRFFRPFLIHLVPSVPQDGPTEVRPVRFVPQWFYCANHSL